MREGCDDAGAVVTRRELADGGGNLLPVLEIAAGLDNEAAAALADSNAVDLRGTIPGDAEVTPVRAFVKSKGAARLVEQRGGFFSEGTFREVALEAFARINRPNGSARDAPRRLASG